MASVSIISSSSPWLTTSSRTITTRSPSASLTLLTGSIRRSSVSFNVANTTTRSGLLHSSFLSSSLSSLSFPSSFSGLSLGLDFSFDFELTKEKQHGLVVRAGKAALCQTKRNRSRKSLARTHGFRRRMRTTSGRALLKRRRAKGRWVLCPKSYPNSGKFS
ncbi:Ribosomal_L34 domain-containing protein [Cephalotus follicularis]|uniref:Large ribosomal subunit protein bL34c n=1 Tax=Cephalotus follicularis TaxID=3775 RepID=A0A1Q3ANV5_CEPFO|nr:Ribosomal_L34 domain-containing protein [Cephalotus follicularis]